MKTLLGTLIWIAVAVGALAAVTAYFVPTNLDPELFKTTNAEGEEVFLVLQSPQGGYEKGTELTPEVLGALSSPPEGAEDGAGPLAKRVHVKEFSWARWSHKWYFVGAALMILVCNLGPRFMGKAAAATSDDSADELSPESTLATIESELTAIADRLPELDSERAKLDMIIDRLGKMQNEELARFVDARPMIVGEHGMGGYARIMDRFAAGERAINRAWSSAADGYLEEATESLQDARQPMGDARELL